MNIIILLVLVIFVYKLLFNKFGLMSDDEKRKQSDVANNFIKNVTNTSDGNTKNKNKVIILGEIEEFNKIYKNYINKTNKQKNSTKKEEFNETKFLKATEKVVSIISDAFSEKRLDVLEKMLTKELFQIFKNKIENSNDLIYKAVIISVLDKKVESKITNKTNKIVTVKITTEQINYVENIKGELISGSKDKVIKITEFWTFIQNQTKNQQENIWLLKSINNA